MADQDPQPVPIGDGVVVEEGDDRSLGFGDPGVAPAREALRLPVGDHPRIGEGLGRRRQQGGIVVDDDEDLDRGQGLVPDRLHRFADVVPSVQGVDADDDRDGGCVVFHHDAP